MSTLGRAILTPLRTFCHRAGFQRESRGGKVGNILDPYASRVSTPELWHGLGSILGASDRRNNEGGPTRSMGCFWWMEQATSGSQAYHIGRVFDTVLEIPELRDLRVTRLINIYFWINYWCPFLSLAENRGSQVWSRFVRDSNTHALISLKGWSPAKYVLDCCRIRRRSSTYGLRIYGSRLLIEVS